MVIATAKFHQILLQSASPIVQQRSLKQDSLEQWVDSPASATNRNGEQLSSELRLMYVPSKKE